MTMGHECEYKREGGEVRGAQCIMGSPSVI